VSRQEYRAALRDGLVAVSPLLVGVAPFGLILGVTAAGSAIGGGLGYATSLIIFGGAAQLAVIQLIDVEAAIATIVITGLVINSRHMMYSAAMTPYFREFSPRSRLALPYLLTDQAFAVSITRYQEVEDPAYRRYFYLGTGLGLWVTWQITTAAGVLIGAQIPESWSLDFAIPLVFVALLAVAVRTKPKAIAALVGGVVAVLAQDAPYQLWMIIGAAAGVAAGIAAERLQQ
jgi:predicted branched-subunit amino acid permease